MRISLDWLKRYIDVAVTPAQLGERLTMAGFPVPSIETAGDDFALEVEITANRPDLLCHLGMAREASGLLGASVRPPEPKPMHVSSERFDVAVEAPDLCPLYAARTVRGLRVAPSPRWMARLLEAAGQRSVNNVVDVTNFVLLESGQPLHAFDLAKLSGARVCARRAPGETMTAIDGKKLVVGGDELAICDGSGPVALAGVMGGLRSEVTAGTHEILLESALFAPMSVRAASRAHQIRSESSFRFERFVDPEGVVRASDRAAELFVDICGATDVGIVCLAGPGVPDRRAEIELRTARVARVFGVAIDEAEIRTILTSLAMGELPSNAPHTTRWRVPSWRRDVVAEIDLVEEVARRVGFDRVPAEVRIPVRPAARDESRRALRRLRDALAGAGLRECCTAPFVGEGPYDIALQRDVPALSVENPMRSEESRLRRSLLGPLLVVARGNKDRGSAEARLFELAPVYLRSSAGGKVDEVMLASGVVSGDYSAAKGCVEASLDALGLERDVTYERGALSPLRRDRSATLLRQGVVVGHVGELSGRACAGFGLTSPMSVFELRADLLAHAAVLETPYCPVPRFPPVERDLAWVVANSVEWAKIESAVRAAAGELLASVRPLNVFRGGPLSPGTKSVALRLELRSPSRTLTGEEADTCVARVIAALALETGGALRS